MKSNALVQKLASSLIIVHLAMTRAVQGGPNSTLAQRPNIVIFIADDLGIGDVGCFGNDTIRTPNIDRIARDGAKLTHNLAAEAICTPSRSALMTGRYPIRSGMATNYPVRIIMHTSAPSGLPSNETTIAEAAKIMGYDTALIGKWHLGVHCGMFDLFCHHPLRQGFDYYYGTPLTNLRDFGGHRKQNTYGIAFPFMYRILVSMVICGFVLSCLLWKYDVCSKMLSLFLLIVLVIPPAYVYISHSNLTLINSMIMRNYDIVEQPIDFGHVTQNLINEGVNFLEREKQADKPFLLVMSWLQVHTVLHASERFQGKSRHGPYGDNVEEMDWSVGEIMNALKRLGLLDNTLVYFTSDNGGHLEEREGEHQGGGWNGIFRGGKSQGGQDGGIRMPTVAMWKGHIEPKTVITVPTSHMDIMPTLLGLWDQPLPNDRVLDGKNIYPLLTGQDDTPPHRFMFHYCGADIHSARYVPDTEGDVFKVYYATPNWVAGRYTCSSFVCFCGGTSVIRHATPLLYNIGRDPAEVRPLDTTDPDNQRIVELVNEAVKVHQQSVETVPPQLTPLNQLPLPCLQHCCNFPYCNCRDTTQRSISK